MLADPAPKIANLPALIVGSIFLSAACLFLLYAFPYDPLLSFYWMLSGLLAIVWMALFLYAVGKFGKRGLWVLPAGAGALWVLFTFLAINFGCAFNRHNCL